MNKIEKIFKGFLIVGFVMLAGRILTAIFRYFDMAFTTFFTDFHLVSLLILVIGIVGTESVNYQKKKRRK